MGGTVGECRLTGAAYRHHNRTPNPCSAVLWVGGRGWVDGLIVKPTPTGQRHSRVAKPTADQLVRL